MTTPSNTQIEGLLERVKAATGPSVDLDREIFVALFDGMFLPENAAFFTRDYYGSSTPAQFTASIDAALALVERVLPGWQVNVATYGPFAEASVGAMDAFNRFRAPTAPLAILVAILATLIAIQSSETK